MNEEKNSMQKLDKNKLNILENAILEAGRYAVSKQASVTRDHKADGSILTEVDLEISHSILSLIRELFPECAIISEEEITEEKDNAPFTFVLDPIDGTDIYSLGLPSFAISLGILDSSKKPVGAIIHAPRFGIGKETLLVRLDPYCELYVDGKLFEKEEKDNSTFQITMGSKSHRLFDFSSFNGKIRTFGSSILHLLLPALISQIHGAIVEPCFVWDIASSHAVLLKMGQDIEYIDGEKFKYTKEFVWNKIPFKRAIYAGDRSFIERIMVEVKPL